MRNAGVQNEDETIRFAPDIDAEARATVTALLSDWLGDDKSFMWSNGADFDLPMLAHAYASYGMTVPWEFWNSRCVRTYRSLPGAKSVPKVEPLVAHNALHDAVAQARHMQRIQAMLKGQA